MSSTTIGIQFEVMDLSASYEVVGTSDNYSFTHNLGIGSKLVDEVGETCDKIIPLYGNYGIFNVRVFAVSQIGIRSEFIQDTISISAPEFDGTFTFSNLRIDNLPEKANIGSVNEYSPLFEGDKLIVNSEFVGKDIQLKWDLVPPIGHANEGKSLNSELLNDTFFDHFEIKIYAGQQGNLISEQVLNDSPDMERELSSADPGEALNFYRDFQLNLGPGTFQDLSLERINSIEIVAHDSFGRTCTGLLTGINPAPVFNSFSSEMNGSSVLFSWNSSDTDFIDARVSGLALPRDKTLYSSSSIVDNYEYYNKLKDAGDWKNIPNKNYQQGQFVKYSDGFVYRSISEHTASSSKSPNNSSYWEKLEEPVDDFFLVNGYVQNNSFSYDQVFGLSYYYGIQPVDGFGTGVNYNISEEGLTVGGDLKDFTSFIQIQNLSYRERKDDLIFSWGAIDSDGNAVDLQNERFILSESDVPRLLGFSGHLFDADTERFVAPITYGNDLSSAFVGDLLEKNIETNLHNARIFYSYEYTRELNNQLYKRGGFPEDLIDFDPSVAYSKTSGPLHVIGSEDKIFEVKANNSIQSPYIKPEYQDWQSNQNYLFNNNSLYSDAVQYENNIYIVNQNFGPEYSSDFFNQNHDYSSGDLVVLPNVSAEIFNPSRGYYVGNLVLYNGEIYKALKNQPQAVTPSLNNSYWSLAKESVDYAESIFKVDRDVSAPIVGSPVLDSSTWILQNPKSSDSFDISISGYDQSVSYKINDLVFDEGMVYKALQDEPTGSPVYAQTESAGVGDINYIQSHWMPIWERSSNYQNVIFGHKGIPESGKRSIGFEIALLDNLGNPIQTERIIGVNQEPSILDRTFRVDSFSEVTKTKFHFNYASESREKTTKVHLYRSEDENFSILDSEGLPGTGAATFVKSTFGPADATFGTNVNTIVDDGPENPPPIDEEMTGYYYKILPFDDFGSGDLYSVDGYVRIYPKGYSNEDPSLPPGPVSENLIDNYVPGPVENFEGDTSFETYFLNWDSPVTTIGNPGLVPRDIKYYEIWASNDDVLKFPALNKNLTHLENTGYNRIGQPLSSIGPLLSEIEDPADGIGNAERILNITASRPSNLDAIYKGKTNQRKYFWIRPVDNGGNKGPFMGDGDTSLIDVKGLDLILGQMETTDIQDFEQNITEVFPNVLSLIPNDPFKDNTPQAPSVSWDRHFIYYNGTGYVIGPGETTDPFIYWSATGKIPTHGESITPLTEDQKIELGLVGLNGADLEGLDDGPRGINNPLRSIYYTGNYDTSYYHPAGEGQSIGVDESKPNLLGPEHDFIIARNSLGTATPMWHAFANATIGTAHIQNAAITNAKVHNLTADKIRSAEIYGQDIQVGGNNLSGQIRSAGFPGLVEPASSQPDGFAISGDGSFVFAADNGRLYFDDGDLTIEGNIRQKDGTEFTLMSLSCEPNYFDYVEDASNALVPQDASASSKISAYYRNSSIDSNQVRFKVTSPGGYEYISYTDHNNGKYDISGFKYDPTLTSSDASFGVYGGFDNNIKKATAIFDVTGFDAMIQSQNPSFLSSLVIFASGIEQGIEHVNSISLLSDGAPGPTGRSPVFRGIWSPDKDYIGVLDGANEVEDLRGDVVFRDTNNTFYMAINSSGPSSVGHMDPSISTNSFYWKTFGAQFESVATRLLLAEDAIITRTLTMGEGELNPSNQYVGHGGVIKTVGKEYANGVTGFFLGNELENNLPNPKFDVGSDESYIRFNGQENKIEIKGTLTLNNVPRTDVDFYSMDGPNATFIGGGYNQNITGYGGFHGLASSIVGGAYNDITGRFSTIVGGFDNNVGDNFSVICAGYKNEMPESTSGHAGANMIGAGSFNKIEGGSLQSVSAGRYNHIEYNPPVIDFGTYINNIYSTEDRSIVFDYDFSPISFKVLGRFGEKAIVTDVSPTPVHLGQDGYVLENSKLGKEVYCPQNLLRGDISAFNDHNKWLEIKNAFYNNKDMSVFLLPRFRGSDYKYYGVWSSPLTVPNEIPKDAIVFYGNKYWRRILDAKVWQSGDSYEVNDIVTRNINNISHLYYCTEANSETTPLPEDSNKWTAGQPPLDVNALYTEEVSPEINFWMYVHSTQGSTIYGWTFVSNVYSINGHWLFLSSTENWIFIYNGFTNPSMMGKYYSNNDSGLLNLI